MARRKKHEDEHDNHERWLVSYADFITILFAFFVVMYALSSVNEGKYRVLSDSVARAFRHIQIDKAAPPPALTLPSITLVQKKNQLGQNQIRRDKMRNVFKEILGVMAPLIEEGSVRVIETSRGVTIEVSDSLLFSPGHAALHPSSVKAMREIAQVLTSTDFPVMIEGHTDNVPINTPQFPSNWELSAVRATTVLRLFVDAGVVANRLTAIGYADTRPVESNLQAEGRARNRRVSILIDAMASEKGKEAEPGAGLKTE